jgi:hypothetical protein
MSGLHTLFGEYLYFGEIVFEVIEPTYFKQLIESINEVVKSLSHLSTTLQNITRPGFDDAGRLRSRVEYLDDGYVRVRDTSGTIDILEMLKEFSWTFYSIIESKNLLYKSVGEVDKPPPEGGVVLLGYDGSLLRRVKVTSDGKLLAQLG